MGAHTARAGDLEDLFEARCCGRLVAAAHVCHVHAVGGGDRSAQGGDLAGVGEDPRHVVEPGRQAQRAIREPGSDQRRHLRELRDGRPRGIHAHHGMARGARGDEVAVAERSGAVVRREELGDGAAREGRVGSVDGGEVARRPDAVAGGVGDAVLPGDDGRDALAEERALHITPEDGAVSVGVRTDEARHHETAGGVEHPRTARRADLATAAITPCSTSTAARRGGVPVPSTTSPPRTSSRCGLTGILSIGVSRVYRSGARRPGSRRRDRRRPRCRSRCLRRRPVSAAPDRLAG